MPAVTAPSTHSTGLRWNVNARISSLLKNPESSGTPAMASAPMNMVV